MRLTAVTRKVKSGQPANLRMRLAGRALARVREAFEGKARLTANVTVVATDLAGNKASRTVHVKLRR